MQTVSFLSKLALNQSIRKQIWIKSATRIIEKPGLESIAQRNHNLSLRTSKENVKAITNI